jgi:predicted patatin/cPLA2 family phospholipase
MVRVEMENEKLFELMEKMYAELQEIKKDVKNNNQKIDSVEKTVLRIEQNHGRKLEALFDGYKQNAEQLNNIEKEVSKHEEVILRRVK